MTTVAVVVPGVHLPVDASTTPKTVVSLAQSARPETPWARVPDKPKNFSRHFGPLPRPTPPPMPVVQRIPKRFAHVVVRSGVRKPGPPIAHAWLNPRTANRNTRALVERFFGRNFGAPAEVTRGRSARGPGTPRRTASVDLSQLNVTGINRWWSYETGVIPGVGRWMVNSFWQNLLVQADDMAVQYRGVDLAFRRTYNSFSNHDYAGTDGSSEVGQFGNGWTNTFDAHVAANSAGGISVYDIDGGRYDYSYDANGSLVPPPGMESTSLVSDDGAEFFWTKKSGTQYAFYAPYYYASPYAAYAGRLYRISGRNRNNYLQFTYAWDTDASSNANLRWMYVTTDSGLQASLYFDDFSGRRLLSHLTYPDNSTSVSYQYDSAGNLYLVAKPPPNNSGQPVYEYYSGYRSDLVIAGPRWNYGANVLGYADGGYMHFHFLSGGQLGSAQVDSIGFVGVMNTQPADGTSTNLWPAPVPAGIQQYNYESISSSSGWTAYTDAFGHQTVQYIDTLGRPTFRYEYPEGLWLVTSESWDARNNMIASVEPRGYQDGANPLTFETDFAYDATDNLIAMARPQITSTDGTFRPTALFAYDSFNNIIAYCDQVATHSLHLEWSGPPAASAACPSSTVARQYQWASQPYEIFGELQATIGPATNAAPNGYIKTYSYDASRQGGVDYGQPTTAAAQTAFAQLDGTSRQPREDYWYTNAGAVACYGTGNGTWVLAYDALNRLVSHADPDDSSAGSGICGKSGGQPGWNRVTTLSYYPDGSLSATQSPEERPAGVSTAYTYDADHEVSTETHHFGMGDSGTQSAAGVTKKFYDGSDRLVEIVLPRGAGDAWPQPWMTRYLYDLTNASVSIPGYSFEAHGNLAVVQEYLPPSSANISSFSWTMTKAAAFDTLDRQTQTYMYSPSATTPYRTLYAYDGWPNAGLLGGKTDQHNEQTSFAYDNDGNKVATQYSNTINPTYTNSFVVDAGGRPVRETNGLFGTRTNVYDTTGVLLSRSIPAYGVMPATVLNYDYYPDDTKKDVGITSSALTQSQLIGWSYRADGRRESTRTTLGGTTNAIAETYTSGGRLQTAVDPFGQRVNSYDTQGRLSSLSFPAGVYSNIGYDPEGLIAGYTGFQNIFGPGGTTEHNAISIRGELMGEQYSPDYDSQHNPLSHGFGTASPARIANGYLNANNADWDVRAKAPLDTSNGGSLSSGATVGYDDMGRLNSGAIAWETENGNFNVFDWSGSYTKGYDAENRLVSNNLDNYLTPTFTNGSVTGCPGEYNVTNGGGPHSGTTAALSYAWNVDNHPWLVDGAPVIWSDDAPLVAFDTQGTFRRVFVDSRATLEPGFAQPMIVLDRDLAGLLVSWHDNTGVGKWTPLSESTLSCGFQSVPNGSSTRAPSMFEPRPDGIWDGFNTIQGVRAFDSSVGTWTTPDPYSGNVQDPLSQQPYMWNRNNPYQYSDPTGFDPLLLPAAIHHPPREFKPIPINPYAKHMNDLLLQQIALGIVAPTGAGVIADLVWGGETLAKVFGKGFFVSNLVSLVLVEYNDKGIDSNYYAQTVYNHNGTATTYVTYKAPDGQSGSFVQYIWFDSKGGWTSRTIFEDGRVLPQSGVGSPASAQDVSSFSSQPCCQTAPAGVGMKG